MPTSAFTPEGDRLGPISVGGRQCSKGRQDSFLYSRGRGTEIPNTVAVVVCIWDSRTSAEKVV